MATLPFVLAASCTSHDANVLGPPPPSGGPVVDYVTEVLPILEAHCFECHGPDDTARQGGVALHSRLLATSPTSHGAPIAPGHPEASLVVQRISQTDPTLRMPLGASPLSAEDISTLTRWIAQGARYESWSFTPPTRPSVPSAATHPVDAFVRDRLARHGVEPSPPADPATLVRRVTLDLTGLPPTPEEVDAFVADPSDAAYEALVDRLLASPRHAEHLAHDWLDLAGYGDSDGIYFDERRTMWPYRDWVIDAFARDVPLDELVIAQLAGDLLPGAGPDDALPTAFLRTHPTTEEGGVDEEQYRIQYAMARTTQVGAALLGLTIQCASCHNHKYDPITQHDFYALTACFNRVHDLPRNRPEVEADGQPTVSAPSPLVRARLESMRSERATAAATLGAIDVGAERASWEAGLPSGAVAWLAPHYASLGTALGTTLSASGARVTASGPSPDVETWELVVDAPATIRALRITTGPIRGEPGYTPRLSEVDAWIESSGARRLVPFERAVAPDGTDLAAVIDGSTTVMLEALQPIEVRLAPAAPIVLASGEQLHLRIDARRGLEITFAHLDIEVSTDARGTLTDAELASLALPEASRSTTQRAALDDAFARLHASDTTREAAQRVSALDRAIATLSVSPLTRVMADDDPARVTHILLRGLFDQPTAPVSCAVPASLTEHGATPPTITNRLDVARWLMGPESPTTARVLANHYVQHILGRGLTSTPGDLGAMGDVPSDPALLDWLAVELRESGWNLDAFLRLLVTSATYRQSSHERADLAAIDPNNRLLARAEHFRLDAEVIRDQALAASGLLVEELGGPPVMPYHPERLYEAVSDHPDAFLITYRPDRAVPALHRRAIYAFWRRATLLPSLALFDAPDRVTPFPRRDRTDTPTQALAAIDEPLFVEAARALAERARRERPGDVDAQITRMFRLCDGRAPRAEEVVLLRAAYDDELSSARSDRSVLGVLQVGGSARDSAGDPAAHAALTLVAQAILASSETMTRE
ncbi:MAG: PSD1 and planctomycete cytochrome C domain-containing protein [Sandaracinus sp.]